MIKCRLINSEKFAKKLILNLCVGSIRTHDQTTKTLQYTCTDYKRTSDSCASTDRGRKWAISPYDSAGGAKTNRIIFICIMCMSPRDRKRHIVSFPFASERKENIPPELSIKLVSKSAGRDARPVVQIRCTFGSTIWQPGSLATYLLL